MGVIGTLFSFVSGQKIQSAQVNQNFTDIKAAFNNSAVLTDTAKTITASHTFSGAQTFSGNAYIAGLKTDGPVFDVTHPVFGAVADDSTDASPAIQAAITAAAAYAAGAGGPFGATVYIPAGRFRCQTALTLSANVSIQGAGMYKSILKFLNSTDGIVLEPGSYDTNCGTISDLQLFGTSSATTKVGLRFLNCGQLELHRVMCAAFGINLRCRDWDHLLLDNCQFGAYYGTAGLIFGDSTAIALASNGLFVKDCWISAASATTSCAVQIDRVSFVKWTGGTIESGGVGMKIGATNTGADGIFCSQILVQNVDFENCVGKYVEVGTAWVGAAFGVYGVTLDGCGGSLSGSTTTTIGVAVANTRGFRCLSPYFVIGTVGVAVFDFVGTNNRLAEIGPSSNPGVLGGGSWLRVNGVVQADLTVEDRVFLGKAAFSDPLGGNQDAVRLSSQSAGVGFGAVNKGAAGGGISYAINSSGRVLYFNNVTSTSHVQFDGPSGDTYIGASGKNLGFYGASPVARAGAITSPNTQTAAYVQADVASLKTAIDAIRVALQNVGITS